MEDKNKLFLIARNRMYSALNAFYIWKIINQSINIHQDGGEEKASENLKYIVNKYKSFFQQTLKNSYITFICDLAIFFDSEKYEESLSLGKLIKIASEQSNNHEEVKSEIEIIKKPYSKSISLVMKLRNQDVAHQGINPEKYTLIYKEFEDLFKAVQEILNKLTMYYDKSITIWDYVEKDMEGDINWMFENLKRGEKQRLKEIEEKYKV